MDNVMASKNEWVSRVLGVSFSAAASATRQPAAARPDAPPKTALTENLLAAITRALPGDAAALPAALAKIVPRFLLAALAEPPMDTPALAAGQALGAQDKALDLADALNAVMRSARKWDDLISQAETMNSALDAMEATERDAAAQEQYESATLDYNATRAAALAEEQRCQALLNALVAAARGMTKAAG
jgi:hypothetical protein